MEIKEFGRVMAREVSDKLGEDFVVESTEVLKNNGVMYHALTIRKEGQSIAPTIYIDHMLEQYNKGTMLMSLVDDVVGMYRQFEPGEDTKVDFFDDFSVVSEHLFFKAVNYKKNRKKLENVPIKRVLDLALVPLVLFKHPRLGSGTIMIENSHLDIWEITSEELWENVIDNAPSFQPLKMKGIMDVLEKMAGPAAHLDEVPDELCGIYVVSNREDCLGAATIFYPGVLKGLSEDFESDLYIIPSSIHECLVIPDSFCGLDVENLREMIHEVNVTTVADEEILSDNLYRYDREEDRLYIVGNRSESVA